jgi:cellulose synthase operon protein C
MHIATQNLDEIRSLYERGLYLQAYERAKDLGPLKEWRGGSARILASQLARQLGGQRLAEALVWCARREEPTNQEVLFFAAFDLLSRRGWQSAWKLAREEAQPGSSPAEQADWYALRARLLAIVRDFESAHHWLDKAFRLDADSSWLPVEQADVLVLEDRREEALVVIEQAVTERPCNRPTLLTAAELLAESGREEEAISLLSTAAQRLESGAIWAHLGQLQTELGQYVGAVYSFSQVEVCSPLMDKSQRQWLIAMQADLQYFLGARGEAAALARNVGTPRYTAFADRLEHPASGEQRVVLPVGFVRQHHITCAPATLASLCAYWSMGTDHLELAAEICYDGTPSHSERAWAERNGLWVREFCVDWASTCALIDAGIPFTLQTVEPTSAHLQAVIGYDACRKTLIVRDPSNRVSEEYDTESFLERYRPHGPRGMVILPVSQADRAAEIELPEISLYDSLYQFQCHLIGHDREAALVVHNKMAVTAPEHRLTLEAQRRLAAYDEDSPALLESAERLLGLFPESTALRVARIAYLKDFSQRRERIALLEEACRERHVHPIFLIMFARELCGDARERSRALDLAQRGIDRGLTANALAVYADLLREGREFAEACTYQRLAACLEYRTERRASSYFAAARLAGQPEEGLAFLHKRVDVLGDQSGEPACTLFFALNELGRTEEGFEVLEASLRQRPDDDTLSITAAEIYLSHGRVSQAEKLLTQAQGRCSMARWLPPAARLAQEAGRPKDALALWREAIERNPLDLAAQSQFARILAVTEGIPAVLAHLEAVAARFPFHRSLLRLCYEWFVPEAPGRAVALLEHLVESEPGDGWAQRELSLRLALCGRWQDALNRLEVALSIDPGSNFGHYLYGWMYERLGDRARAHEGYAQAIKLDVDYGGAISGLLGVCEGSKERHAALALVWRELETQVVYGDGLFAFRAQASSVLEPEDLLERMRLARTERPDLWQSWSALVDQLIETGRMEEALTTAQQACERFQLVPQLWLDLERVHALIGDASGRMVVLEKALVFMPGNEQLVRALADAYEDQGDFVRSRNLLGPAVEHAPLNSTFHGFYASVLWRLDEQEKALEHIALAVRLNPAYDWAWGRLQYWSESLKQPKSLSDALHELTERRPAEVRSWLLLAEYLSGEEYLDERLAALDRAVLVDPRNPRCHDLRAILLVEAKRYEEALVACSPLVFGDTPPQNLRGRAAWVEAQRGERARAIDAMVAVLAIDQDYSWGWGQLSDWYERTDDAEANLYAAQQLLRLDSQSKVSHGYVADALLRLGQRSEARAVLEHSLRIDPQYRWASRTLFRMQMEDTDLEGATVTLAQMHRQLEDEETTAFSVQLAARRGELDLARTGLTLLLEREETTESYLSMACWAMLRAGFAQEMFDCLDGVIQTGNNPHAAACRIRFLTDKGQWDECIGLIDSLSVNSDAWRNACIKFITCATRRRYSALLPWLEKHSAVLASDDRLWGMAGYALVVTYLYRKTISWLANWQERPGLANWMLLNLVVALRGTGRLAEARAVHHAAIDRFPDENSHRLWLAWDAVLAGDFTPASLVMRGVRTDELNSYYRFLVQLVRAALAVGTASNLAPSLGEAVQILRRAVGAYPALPRNPLLRRVYRQCVRFILHQSNGSHLSLRLALWLLASPRKHLHLRWPMKRLHWVVSKAEKKDRVSLRFVAPKS